MAPEDAPSSRSEPETNDSGGLVGDVSSSTPPSIWARLGVVLLMIQAAVVLLSLALLIPTAYDLSYPEGAVVARMMDVASGETPYTDWRVWPHAFAPYGPLTYYPLGWLSRVVLRGGSVLDFYILGRIHSFVFLAGLWGLLFGMGRRLSLSWTACLVAVVAFSWWRYLQEFALSYRPDAPQVFFALLAVWIALGGRATGKRLFSVLAALMVSFWFKPTSWGIPIALALWAASGLGRAKAALAFAAFGLTGLIAVLVLNVRLDGALILNMLGVADVGWEPFRFFDYLEEVPILSLAVLGGAVLNAAIRLRSTETSESERLLARAFLLSLTITVVQFAKNGAYWNYFVAPYALASLMIASGFGRLLQVSRPAPWSRGLLAILFTVLLVTVGSSLRGAQEDFSRARVLSHDLPGTDNFRSVDQQVLSYDPYFSLTLGSKPCLLDIYQLSLLAAKDESLEEPLLNRTRRGEFDLILIPGLYLEQKAFYPSEFYELLSSRYVESGRLGSSIAFRPATRLDTP